MPFLGLSLGKWKKEGHFYYQIYPLLYIKSDLIFSIFLMTGLEMALWPFLALMAILGLQVGKIGKIRPLSLLNLKKFL